MKLLEEICAENTRTLQLFVYTTYIRDG